MIVIVVVVHAVRVCVRRLCGCLGADMFYLASTFVSLGPLRALTTPANMQVSCRERERVVVDQWGSTTQSTRPTSPCSRTWRSSTTRDSGRGTGRRPLKLRGGRRRALVALHQDIATRLASGLSPLPGVRCGGTSSLSEWARAHRCTSATRPHHLIAAMPWQRWHGSQPLAF